MSIRRNVLYLMIIFVVTHSAFVFGVSCSETIAILSVGGLPVIYLMASIVAIDTEFIIEKRLRERIKPFRPSERSYYVSHYTGQPCVYILQDTEVSGYCKIGYSTRLDDRLSTFGVQLPFMTRLLHIIPTEDMRQLEADLHERYADKRKLGEWFALTARDIEYLKGL